MKKILHLTVTQPLPDWAEGLIAAQKNRDDAEVEVLQLTAESAPVVLEKIFAADSICVWPGKV